ncbi:hypothetical protein U14_01601 [Candidatus Moduliflexus flocculans]|uniref:Uncharacterized protein n=1 Tax=Candidatus Moduliflexus flocculans TaxID=1499966 RepID=A0A0S6VY72_9BACT|nr:hypothetical protein U14_01601 [Candidatus Moduliflexus flocculans]
MLKTWLKMLGSVVTLGLLMAVPLFAETVEPGKDGKVAADTEFRPKPHGFKFENWGGGENPQGDLTADDARCLFGDQVCARIKDGKCEPTPAAKTWVKAMNKSMTGGHCEGMAALSAAFFAGAENAQDYGAKTAFDLETSNAPVMRAISTYFVTQGIEPVASKTAATRDLTLKEIVDTLTNAMKTPDEIYTLGIYGADGGHAITPYAVEDLGKGNYRIYVYDNNYPGAGNYVEVDLNADTWSYAGAALNPSEKASPWTGNSGSMDLTRLDWRYEPLICPFCDNPKPVNQLQGCLAGKAPQTTPQKPTQTPESQTPIVEDAILVYTDADCDGLLITDKKTSKQLRSVHNKIESQIPGAFLMALRGTPGCFAKLPASGNYEFSLIGQPEQPKKPVDITFTRPGMVYDVSDITLSEANQNTFQISEETFVYTPAEGSKPTVTVALDNDEGKDEMYVITDLTLRDGHSFTVGENKDGQFMLSSDDPDQEPFDMEIITSDEEGDTEHDYEDVALPEDGEATFDLDDEGNPTMDIDDAEDDGSDNADEEVTDDDTEDDGSDKADEEVTDDDTEDDGSDNADEEVTDDDAEDDGSDNADEEVTDDDAEDDGSDDAADDASDDSSDGSGSDDDGDDSSDDSSDDSGDSGADDSSSDDGGDDGGNDGE